MPRRRQKAPPSVGRSLLASMAAGAAGTLALNATTYLDMLIRGRPASQVPSTVASRLTDAVGLTLGEGSAASNRSSALGGLLGNLTGVSVALGYGLTRRITGRLPLSPAAAAVGATAMASSDVPATVTGATHPSSWGVAGWVSDMVPHAAYGLATVAVYEALTGGRETGRPPRRTRPRRGGSRPATPGEPSSQTSRRRRCRSPQLR